MGRVGHSRLINDTMLVCRVIGNVHTVAGMWLVDNMSWVCMLMGPFSCVCWECTLMLGVKNVI